MEIRSEIKELEKELIEIRRYLHRIPEMGFHEVKTKEFIKDYLEKLSPDILEAGAGVKAVFKADGEGAIAFRADIDALPVKEETGLPFSSEHEGFMHACGHDGHTSILLIFAKYVSMHRNELKKSIVLIFQPCEETAGGAKVLVDSGILEDPQVEAVYGLHIWPEFMEHNIVVTPGPLMSGMDDFYITFEGKRAHGALPHLGNDAIVAAAAFIMNAQTVISRNISSFDSAVFTVGTINGGTAPNVLADKVELTCTLRAFTDETLAYAKDRLMSHLKAVGEAYCIKTSICPKTMGYPVINDPELANGVQKLIEQDNLLIGNKVMVSEDFSYYQRFRKGLFMLLGSGNGKNTEALHSSKYVLNEGILADGVELFARIADIK